MLKIKRRYLIHFIPASKAILVVKFPQCGTTTPTTHDSSNHTSLPQIFIAKSRVKLPGKEGVLTFTPVNAL